MFLVAALSSGVEEQDTGLVIYRVLNVSPMFTHSRG